MADPTADVSNKTPLYAMETAAWPAGPRLAVVTACGVSCAAALVALLWNGLNAAAEPMRRLDAAALSSGWRISAARIEAREDASLATPAEDGWITLTSPPLDFSADACPSPRVVLDGPAAAAGFDCTLEWRRRGDPTRYAISRSFPAVDRPGPREIAFDDLPFQPGWVGRIGSLKWHWRLKAWPTEPMVFLAAGAPAARGGALAAMLWRQWWWRDPIESHTINTIRAPHVLGRSPNVILLMVLVIAASVHVLVTVLRRGRLSAVLVLAILLAAWLLNDARWALGQRRQLATDKNRFASALLPVLPVGAAFRWEVETMATLANGFLPSGSIYAVAGADPSICTRLRYLLSPQLVQVNLDPLQPRVAMERAQFILVMDNKAVHIDPATHELHAEGFPMWRVRELSDLGRGMLIVRRVRP